MPRARSPSLRRLPDGTPLHNRLLAALPRAEYDRILQYVTMTAVTTGHTLGREGMLGIGSRRTTASTATLSHSNRSFLR
jgi:hypothetical protein